MEQVVLVIHLLIAVALIGVVLVQKSEGGLGGLGGGGGGGFGGLMTSRGSANLLTRTTAVLAGLFMLTSLALVMIAGGHGKSRSILDTLPQSGPATTAPQTAPQTAPKTTAPNTTAPATPAKPPAGGEAPSVPVSK